MTLRGARILSSCNDASNKQEQKMNVNIKLEDNAQTPPLSQTPSTLSPPAYPPPGYPSVQPVNFTIPPQPSVGEFAPSPLTVPNLNPTQSRDVDLAQDILQKDLAIADLETKNKFLQLLLRIHQNNPLFINSILVCKSQDLMDMIKLLTKCDKVDLVLNEDIACGGCGANSKLIYVSKILITKGDETKEMKYGYNEAYSKLISFGINTKIVC